VSSKLFSESLLALPVTHEFIPCQSPNDNAYVESFHSQIEVGCLSTQKFKDYGSCYEAIVSYIEFYNTKRIHGKLKMSPKDFECYIHSQPKEILVKYEISA
jgi:putative transposase